MSEFCLFVTSSFNSSIYVGLINSNVFYCIQGNNHKRFGPRGTKANWVDPYQFILDVWKAIISRELAQGILSLFGLIPSIVLLAARQLYQ